MELSPRHCPGTLGFHIYIYIYIYIYIFMSVFASAGNYFDALLQPGGVGPRPPDCFRSGFDRSYLCLDRASSRPGISCFIELKTQRFLHCFFLFNTLCYLLSFLSSLYSLHPSRVCVSPPYGIFSVRPSLLSLISFLFIFLSSLFSLVFPPSSFLFSLSLIAPFSFLLSLFSQDRRQERDQR